MRIVTQVLHLPKELPVERILELLFRKLFKIKDVLSRPLWRYQVKGNYGNDCLEKYIHIGRNKCSQDWQVNDKLKGVDPANHEA